MNQKYLFVISIISILLYSCSSIKLKNGVTNNIQNSKIDSVKIIAKNEKLLHNGLKIGEFVMREDLQTDWDFLKTKIDKFAKKNGANLVEIRTLGWGKKGNGFYADGTLFYVENINNVKSVVEDNCKIYIVRDNLESIIGSAFTINLKINETEFKNLKGSDIAKKEFSNCNQNVDISVNGKIYNIKLKGESRYFKVGKQTSGNTFGGGIAIGIGGVSLIEIENKEVGRLLIYQNE